MALALAVLLGAVAVQGAQASYLHVRPAVAHESGVDGDDDQGAWSHSERQAGDGWHRTWEGTNKDGRHGQCHYDAKSDVVYEDVQMVMTESHFTDWFYIDTAGTYKGTLTDFAFPAAFSTIGLSITTSTDTLASIVGPGTFTFDAQPGKYFLSFFAKTDEEAMFGQYGIRIVASSGDPAPAPLPSGLLLLGSGLLATVRVARSRRGAV